jgi:membrane-associated phospholipid phosphatase
MAPLLCALLLAAAGPADAPPADAAPPEPSTPGLTVDLASSASVTGGLLLLSGLAALEKDRLVAPACRWCEPPALDRWARGQLAWRQPARASSLSDALVVAVPAGAALALGAGAWQAGGWREAEEDLLVAAEAVAVATLLTEGAKYGAGRLRPSAWAAGGAPTAEGRLSFWSGHSALAFSAAAAATQVARLRGRPAWRLIGLVSFAGAAAVGWLRVAGDQHWLSDVLTGAVVGSACGLGVPLLVLRAADGRRSAVTLAPAPGGLALLF